MHARFRRCQNFELQRVLIPALMLLAVTLGTHTTFAQQTKATIGPPDITELRTTETSHAWMAQAPLPDGYVEREFQISGMAGIYAYASPPPPPWNVTLQDTQPYTTRLIVRRPSDPGAFNGTVVVEWLNVTNGFDVDIEWTKVAQYFTRSGYAFVGVSAQGAGVDALKKWDPGRYGNLSILDDGQSYDIFTQAAVAVRQPGSPLLGGLNVQQVIATGVSQSAWRLVPYINAFHALAHVYDGYFVHSRGRGVPPIQGVGIISDQQPDPIDPAVDVPVLVFETEGDLLTLDYAIARQPDTDHVRTWELPGAPHVGGGTPYDNAIAAGVRARDTGNAAPPGNPACQTNPFPAWPVADSGWDHLRAWVAGGPPPPTSPLISLSHTPTFAAIPPGDTNALIARDDLGNALGGIRTPAIDAPVGAYYGSSPCNPGALGFLAGLYVPFDAPTLAKLYPTHDIYVAKVTASANQAVTDGFMLQDDARQLIQDASASTIGKLGSTVAP
jgi:alpha/beta hydrolase family protein